MNLLVRFDDRSIEVEPGGTARIGRAKDADLVVAEPDVSRHHVTISSNADGTWLLTDEDSANGTFIDGQRLAGATTVDESMVVHLGGRDTTAVIRLELREPAVVGTQSTATDAAHLEAGTVLKGSAPQPFRDTPVAPVMLDGVEAITLGKAPDNDIVIDDINVSRHHARVIVADGGFLVEDLNSLNGTLLNAVPVQRAFMSDSDVLTLGNTDLVRRGDRLVLAEVAERADRGLRVDGVSFTIPSGKRLIDDVAFTAGRGTLTAVIGPSGAGKSTLARLLSGGTAPSGGTVAFDGFDLQRDYQAVKTRVGLVPQDDVVHRQLRLRRALRYAADLRLPRDVDRTAKTEQVDKTIAQLALERHADTRIEALSGGQRKRASIALELLTEPALLILDEPTSGLDPALDRQVMRTLRELADGGRTVIVITHSVAYLDLCDQVLVLAPGGLPAYVGPSAGIGEHFASSDWADVFAALAEDPVGSSRRWKESFAPTAEAITTTAPATRRPVRSSSAVRQFVTTARRQVAVTVADRGYFLFLLALPILLGLLPAVVPGGAGLNAVPRAEPSHAGEPTSVLALLIMGATFMGVAMSIRDLVGERPIFLRERAVGLSPTAYLLAKLVVFGVFSIVSAAILTAVSALVKAPPSHHLFALPPMVELFIPIALTTWVAAALGLAISAFVGSNDQVMPALILVLMVQLVLHGGLIPVLDPKALDAVSRFVPARWGFAAGASGIDLEALLAPGIPTGAGPRTHDPLWAHSKQQWVRDTGVLSAFGAVFTLLAIGRLRLSRR